MTTQSYQVDLLTNAGAGTTGSGYWWPGGKGLLITDATFAGGGVAGFQYRTGPSSSFFDYSVINPATGAPVKVSIDQRCAINFSLPPCEIRATTDANTSSAYVRAIRIPD